jgi:hypothetical protein
MSLARGEAGRHHRPECPISGHFEIILIFE